MMAKAKRKPDPNARQPSESYWQHQSRLQRQAQEVRDKAQPLVSLEAEQHGDYHDGFVMHVEEGKKAYTKINRGGTPVDRWKRDGKLTQDQEAVIALCVYLWRLASLNPKVTATYGERIASGSYAEERAAVEIQARKDLHRIMGYFPGPLKGYFDVFENICRFDMPAGVAGATLEYGSRSAEVRAHQIVCMVADTIAMREGI